MSIHSPERVKSGKFSQEPLNSPERKEARYVPGVGSYSPDANRVKENAPGYGFSGEKRGKLKVTDSPGAGAYHIPSKMGNEGQKSTIHSTIDRALERREEAHRPGPGSYLHDANKVKSKAPSYKMGEIR